jgi:hypothetical protein
MERTMTLSGLKVCAACVLAAGLMGGCTGGTIDNYPPGLLSHGTSLEHTIQQPMMKSAGTSAPATAAANATTAAPTAARSTAPAGTNGHGGGGNAAAAGH